METLWRSEELSTADFKLFKYGNDPNPGVGDTRPGWTAFYTNNTLLSQQEFDKWLPKAQDRGTGPGAELSSWLGMASPTTKTEDCFALLLLPAHKRPTISPSVVNRALLRYLSVSEDSFKSIGQSMSVPHAFAVILKRGVPTISRAEFQIGGEKCFVYTLRTEHTLEDQSLMSITHFPKANPSSHPLSTASKNGTIPTTSPVPQGSSFTRIYTLILGYGDTQIKNLQECLQNCKESIMSPFTPIKAFLKIERDLRFEILDAKITNFVNVLKNYGSKDSKATPKSMIDLYLDIGILKLRLMAWSAQIADLQTHVEDFVEVKADIDPDEYLRRLVDEYEIKINKCEIVLQGASLAFQMETAHLARLDSANSIKVAELARGDSIRSIEIAELSRLESLSVIRDGKQMKAIALLTMIFLPGTFIATVLAVPVFEGTKTTTLFPPWAWYPILFVPLTVVVLVMYFSWTLRYKSEEQKKVVAYKPYKAEGMKDVSLTPTGTV